MRNAVILHGKPSQAEFENPQLPPPHEAGWLGWAKVRLLADGIFTVNPALPEPYAPKFYHWQRELRQYEIGPRTTVIGHSAGAGFILKWLKLNPQVTVDRVILVAPWVDPNRKYTPEFDFVHKKNITAQVLGRVTVFYSSLDDDQTLRSLARIRSDMPQAEYLDIPHYGHFKLGNTMESEEFPELLDVILDPAT